MAGCERVEVEVSGLTDEVDNDYLQLYFESRRSGGGTLRSLSRDGPQALLTFLEPEDAARVVSKREHHLHHVTVRVRRPPPWDPKRAALRSLDPNTDNYLLELYVEAVSGCNDVPIVRSADKSNALLTFPQELSEEDFQHLLARVEKKKLQNRSISAHRVRVSADLLVQNIDAPMSMELLEMYFESKRSGGGEVRSVTALTEDAAVVSFCDWNVVDRVLTKAHVLQNRQLSVSFYYPDLLGRPIGDLPQGAEMEEEPDSARPNDGRTEPGVTAEGRAETSVPGGDEAMLEVGSCDAAEEVDGARCGGSDVPRTGPEASPSGPQIPANRCEELGAPRAQSSPDKGVRLVDPAQSSVPWGDGGFGETPKEAPNSVQEAEVVMEAAELIFMQKYRHDLLAGMDAGMDAVTIFPLEEEDKYGFKVVGDAFSCKTAVEVLQHVVSSLSSRTITLAYPWVSHFLLESEGQRALRDIEEQHHCVIDTSHIAWKVLDCLYTDPWSFVNDAAAPEPSPAQPMITDEAPDNPLLQADLEGIKKFASLLHNEEEPTDVPSTEAPTTAGSDLPGEDLGEDLYTDRASKEDDATTTAKDEELDQVCQMSRREYQDQQLDEEAQLLLAIQRSMDTQGVSSQEDEELQRALEMSLLQSEDSEESLQRALEMSLQDQRSHGFQEPIRMQDEPMSSNHTEVPLDLARIRVLAGDETGIVVAGVALRKAITSRLNTVSLEGTNGVQNVDQILEALQKKHKVKVSKYGRELQIQGFLQGPSQCRKELSEILDVLQARAHAKAEVPTLDRDVDRDVKMIDVPEGSEENQRVVQLFLKTLQDQSLEVIQVQKVDNAVLYNQYQLKKLRTVMTDPNIPAERILYHGTTETSAKEICHSGFNRSFSGKNATFYGQGVYFAVESEVSTRDTYSPPNAEGKKFVFMARVLTGEFTQGKENMRTPPMIPNQTGGVPRRYDSLVNRVQDPSFFVIFNDTQAYPEYLITCRKRSDPAK